MLLASLLLALMAASACGPSLQLPEPTKPVYAPPPGKIVTFETTVASRGFAERKGPRQAFDTTLSATLDQSITTQGLDGFRRLAYTVRNVAVTDKGRRQLSKATYTTQLDVDPFGRTFPLYAKTAASPQAVGRQETVEAVIARVQPIFSGRAPRLGDSWESTRAVPILAEADMEYRFKYRVIGSDTFGGKPTLKVAVSFDSSGTALQKQHYTYTRVAGKQAGGGTTVLDAATLQTVEADMRWHSDMKYVVSQMSLSTSTTIVSDSVLLFRALKGIP